MTASSTRRGLLAGMALLPLLPRPVRGGVRLPANLRRGLSASFWFEWVPAERNALAEHLAGKYQTQDWGLIRELGFDHVRVPIQPEVLAPGLGRADATLDPERLALFDQMMGPIVERGLALVVDAHPRTAFKNRLAADPAHARLFADWWRQLAAHLDARNGYGPDRTYLELLNEPEDSFADTARYRAMMQDLIDAARQGAPHHTLLVGGNRWNTPEGLFHDLKTPFTDPNIIYVFHFYQPMLFTHQGLKNAGALYGRLHDIPWGFPAGGIGRARLDGAAPDVRPALERYVAKSQRKDDLRWWFQQTRAWCDSHACAAWMGEFGVYRNKAPAADRAGWITATRELAEEHGFGWNMWEAQGGFGLFRPGTTRPLQPEAATLRALGLA